MADHAGQVIRRREDPRLVTGRGLFIDDLRVEGCLHVAIARSPHAHAAIRAIDTGPAAAAPGVVAVVTAAGPRRGGRADPGVRATSLAGSPGVGLSGP